MSEHPTRASGHPVPPTLRRVVEALPDLIVVVDRSLSLQYMNRPQGGFSPEQVVGHSILDFMDPAYRTKVRALIESVFDSGEPQTYEIPAVDAEGRRQWHEGTITAIRENDDVVFAVINTKNVTDRKEMEEEANKLRRLIPLCSWCNKIRSDQGYWDTLEAYVETSERGRVTHGVCPGCEAKMFGGTEEESA